MKVIHHTHQYMNESLESIESIKNRIITRIFGKKAMLKKPIFEKNKRENSINHVRISILVSFLVDCKYCDIDEASVTNSNSQLFDIYLYV